MNQININITYVSNFKPTVNINKNFNFNYKNRIACKNFILFMLFLKKFFKNKNVLFFVKPLKNSNLTLLRSPYRHKLTRHQLTFSRFYFLLKLIFPLKQNIVVNTNSQLVDMINELNKFLKSFETNICNQHKIKFILQYKYKNFFKFTA